MKLKFAITYTHEKFLHFFCYPTWHYAHIQMLPIHKRHSWDRVSTWPLPTPTFMLPILPWLSRKTPKVFPRPFRILIQPNAEKRLRMSYAKRDSFATCLLLPTSL